MAVFVCVMVVGLVYASMVHACGDAVDQEKYLMEEPKKTTVMPIPMESSQDNMVRFFATVACLIEEKHRKKHQEASLRLMSGWTQQNLTPFPKKHLDQCTQSLEKMKDIAEEVNENLEGRHYQKLAYEEELKRLNNLSGVSFPDKGYTLQ